MSVSTHAAFLERRHFGSLDGIRGLSILAVVWHHARPEQALPEHTFWVRGFLGVDMFFVLSGFLIVTLLLRERDRHGRVSLRSFYARRVFRIFPLYYAVITVLTLWVLLRPSTSWAGDWWDELPALLTYTGNWFEITTLMAVAWSLAAEEQFYLFWPPLEARLRRFVPHLLVGLLLLSEVVHFGAFDALFVAFGQEPGLRNMLQETTFTPILLGVALAHVLHDPGGFRWAARLAGWRYAPVAAVAVIGALLVLAPADIRAWARLAFHLGFAFLLASCVVREEHELGPVLRWPPLVRIGVISYGMYLLHPIARHFAAESVGWVERIVPGVLFVTTLALSVVVAELSFRFFETPFLRLKKRFGRVVTTEAPKEAEGVRSSGSGAGSPSSPVRPTA